MGFHTFPVDRAPALEDETRFRYVSREELVGPLEAGVDADATVADLGSGTGFYTDEVAPFVGTLYAVDVQPGMHDYYRSKGVPANVRLVTAAIGDLPFDHGQLDGAVTTMTFHEFADPDALAEVRRVLEPESPLVVADWTANGRGERGPPLDERFDCPDAVDRLETAGFVVDHAAERPETYLVVARSDQ